MTKGRKIFQLAWRLGVCAAVLVAITVYFAHDLAPAVPLLSAFAWVICGAAIVGAAMLAAVIVQGSFNQWTFRKGGMDTQWLWFRADPPGTAQLRELRRDKDQ